MTLYIYFPLISIGSSFLQVNSRPMQTKPAAETSSVAPLQFNDAICKRLCVTAISELFDTFHNFRDRFVDEIQAADESRAYELSEKLGALSRRVYQRKLLLQKVREKTPCDCADEFSKIDEFEDHIDEGYDFLLIKFDKIEEDEYTYPTEVNENQKYHPGNFWEKSVHTTTNTPF